MFLRTVAAAAMMMAGPAFAQQNAQPGRDRDRALQPDRNKMANTPVVRAAEPTLIPSEWALGAKVLSSASRDKIGSVKDLALVSSDGRVEYAIISHGGVLGVGNKLIAVPWEALSYESKDRVLAIGFTEDQLKAAPEFKDDQWPMLGEKTWRQKVSDFFGTSRVGRADSGRGDHDLSWGMNSRYQTLVKDGQRATVRGVAKDIDNKSPSEGMGEGCIVTITDQNGRDQIVHLGPAWFVKHQRTILKTGDNVEVLGTQITVDGHDVIAVRTITGPEGSFQFRDDQGRPVWDAATTERTTAQGDNPLPGEPAQPARPDQTARPGERILATPEAMGGHTYLKASTIKGQNLKTAQGESAGEIKDFVFDASSGQMGFLVVGFGGFLGMADERVAVPWSMFTIDNEGKMVLSQINKEQLKNAPRFSKKDWAELNDPATIQRVYQYYGLQWPSRPDRDAYRPGERDRNNPNNPDRNPPKK